MEKPGFGAKLFEVRKAKGFTQEEVAENCGITVRTIQRIESGVVEPRVFTIKTISETLGFDFFDNSGTGNEDIGSQNSELKKPTILWYVQDLFNLKTNKMKKISILSSATLIVILCFITFSSNIFAVTPIKRNSIYIQENANKSVERIEVRFSNQLTFDSLIVIKNVLETFDIPINYKKLEFDDNNRLYYITCEASTGRERGSFSMYLSDSTKTGGFYRDYSKDAKPTFCIGSCGL